MRYETPAMFWERVAAEGRAESARAYEYDIKQGKKPMQIASLLVKNFQPADGEEVRLAPPHMKKALEGARAMEPSKADIIRAANEGEIQLFPQSTLSTDWKAEIDWTYQHLSEQFPKQPPSAGAKSLHKWARENTSEFFRTFVTRLLPARSKEDVEGRDEDDGRVLQLIDRVLGKLGQSLPVPAAPSSVEYDRYRQERESPMSGQEESAHVLPASPQVDSRQPGLPPGPDPRMPEVTQAR